MFASHSWKKEKTFFKTWESYPFFTFTSFSCLSSWRSTLALKWEHIQCKLSKHFLSGFNKIRIKVWCLLQWYVLKAEYTSSLCINHLKEKQSLLQHKTVIFEHEKMPGSVIVQHYQSVLVCDTLQMSYTRFSALVKHTKRLPLF